MYGNLTRLVVVVWLFVVFILTSSYTASLSSMLTVQRLKPNITDVEWLKRTNAKVGCDGDSFVWNYLENVLRFKSENILKVDSEYKYQGEFERNDIAAAFLELPYEKVFVSQYCKKFTASTPTYRFGGLGFVSSHLNFYRAFPILLNTKHPISPNMFFFSLSMQVFKKGTPIAADFSEAILKLSENGVLKSLEENWFNPAPECSANATDNETESLSLHSFWGIYLISGAISTICSLIFLFQLRNKYRVQPDTNQENTAAFPPTLEKERGVPGETI